MNLRHPVSMRSRLLLLVAGVMLLTLLAATGWTYATFLPVLLASLLLLALGIGGALWISSRIAAPIDSLAQGAARLQAGEALALNPTGIIECDAVAAALADASAAIKHAHEDLQRCIDAASGSARETERRASRSQHTEALGRLTGGVAHDFNNLLGVISSSAHLIERSTADPQVSVLLASILRSVETGSRLTQHLVRMAGHQMRRPQRVVLQDILPEKRELLETVLGRQISLAIDVAPDAGAIEVDAGELELALVNLAVNAREAIRGAVPGRQTAPGVLGQVHLCARAATLDEIEGLPPRAYTMVSVADDGRGLDEGLFERVFDPFFTTKPIGAGSGLGLSQVRGFCTQAGGIVRLRSTRGLGAVVSLLLPALPPATAAEGERVAALVHEVSDVDASFLRGLRLLLVDDNEELCDMTAALLRGFGCRTNCARDAQQALDAFEPGRPPVDIVLSDVVMPGSIDGVALARLLRRRYPQLPLVLTSGYSAELAAGGEFVLLAKPSTPRQLLAALREAVDQAQAAGSASPFSSSA